MTPSGSTIASTSTSIYREVESAIQGGMDRLAKQRRFPVFA